MRTIKLVVQYDGGDYVGWQRQGKGVSVQGLIEEALTTIDGAPVTLHGAGRTDAGVHAIGQVASARVTSPIEDWQLVRALNAHLPDAIRVTELTTVPDAFHARFSATAKTYEYRIWNGRTVPPFVRRYAWHVIEPLNLPPMEQASQAIPGEHDFAAFRSARSMNHTTVRRITSAGWRRDGEHTLVFEIGGQGFLRYMVRSLVGTLVEIGRGQRPVGDVARLLAAPDRTQAGRTAPALGLFLMRVEY
ncbi:MAG TPA: tRNA pseudouridine(38-40) synthase TruA [Vicinamibacterales bacterium]|nr:tRNA pseudouridine(38-40) synthase TruA [Vicinamibacterales bacterium]